MCDGFNLRIMMILLLQLLLALPFFLVCGNIVAASLTAASDDGNS